MTIVKKKKKALIPDTVLDNGIRVRVKRLSEQDQLRAAGIFDAKQIDRAGKNRKTSYQENMQLWKGNEAYLFFVVERSATLVSPMPDPDEWLGPFRRNALAWGIQVVELEDKVYLETVYIRCLGMTTDAYVNAVTNPAMGIKQTEPAKIDEDEEEYQAGVAVANAGDEEDEEDEDDE